MNVNVQIKGLFNHRTGKDYKKGLQLADEALKRLAKKKSKNMDGVIMVLADKSQKFDEDDELNEDAGEEPDNSNDNVDIALRNGLDLNDKFQKAIHVLLNGAGFTYSAITREMGDDSKKPLKVAMWRDKSITIIERLEKDSVICKNGKKWGYITEGV